MKNFLHKLVGSNNALTNLNRNIGASLRDIDRENSVNVTVKAKRVQEILTSDKTLEELTSNVRNSMAIIDALQNTLDSIEFKDSPAIQAHREQLQRLSHQIYEMEAVSFQATETQNVLKGTLQEVFKIIHGSTEQTRSLFSRHLSEARKNASDIAPGLDVVTAPAYARFDSLDDLYSSIGISDARKALINKRYNQWRTHLGSDDFFDLVHRDNQTYLRIYSDKKKKRFIGLGYLDLGRNATDPYTAPLYVRNNESLTTTYMVDRYVTDVEGAQKILSHGRTNITEDIIRQNSRPWEDVLNDIGFRHLKSGGPRVIGSRKKLGAQIRALMAVAPRTAVEPLSGNPVIDKMRAHQRLAGRTEQNFLLVTGLDRLKERERWKLVQQLSATPATDPTARDERAMGRVMTDSGYAYHAEIGLYRNSPLSQYDVVERELVGESSLLRRRYVPKTSRLEQASGREEMFVGQRKSSFKNPVFQSGPERAPIGYSPDASGGTNKLFIFHTGSDGLSLGLDGQGVAYHTRPERALRTISKPILNPEDNFKQGSRLTRYLMTHNSNELVEFDIIDGVLHKTIDGKSTRFGNYLGHGTEARQYIRFNGQQRKVYLGWQHASVSDKSLINILGFGGEEIDSPKMFSPAFKGTAQRVKPQTFNRVLGAGGRDILKRVTGGRFRDVMLTIPDQVFKAPATVTQSVINNLVYFTNDMNMREAIVGHAKTLGASEDASIRLIRSAIAVAGGRTHLGATEAGLSLNLAYHGFVKGGVKGKYGYTEDMFEKDIHTAFGGRAGEVLAAARGNYGMAFGTAFKGSGVGDWGAAMGSTESRVVFNMYHQLKLMGFDTNQATDFIQNMYHHKKGNVQGVKTSSAFINMFGSITNNNMTIHEMLHNGISVVNVQDIINSPKSFIESLKTNPKGFLLDFGRTNSPADRALRYAAEQTFHGSTQIYIPGSEILKSSDSTMINTAAGKVPVGQELEGTINEFLFGLRDIGGHELLVKEHGSEIFGNFQNSVINLGSEAIHNTLSGKMTTASFQYSNLYDLTNEATSNLSPSSFRLANKIMAHTGNSAVFVNSQGFLSGMLAAREGGLSREQVIRNMERFFTATTPGSEANMQGVVTFWTRHPALSLGNVSPVQVYRDLNESKTEFLPEFSKTRKGRQWTKRMGAGFTWDEVAGLDRGARSRFFSDFFDSMKRFVGEGGGIVSIPRTLANVTVNGKSTILDISLAAAGLGDHDGDQEQLMFLNDKYVNQLISGMKASGYQRRINEYRIRSQVYGQETKKALRVLEAQRLNISPDDIEEQALEVLYQDILKEGRGKQTIGPLDNQMNRLRRAIGAGLDGTDLDRISDIAAFLKMTEEHISIKTKKLPSYEDLATQLKNHIDTALSATGSVDDLNTFLRDVVFAGSDLHKGIDVTYGDVSFRMSLDETLAGLSHFIGKARSSAVSDFSSSSSIAGVMRSGSHKELEQLMNILMSGETPVTAAVRGFEGRTVANTVASATHAASLAAHSVGGFNAKHASALALAGLGLSVFSSVVFGNELDNLPRRDDIGAVNKARSMMATRDPNVSPDSLISSGGSDIVRPMGVGTTYATQPNAYQVRGRITSQTPISAWQNYIQRTNGNMSVIINDTRRPITPNYIDRVTGEY